MNEKIIIYKEGEQVGPFTIDDIKAYLRRGVFNEDTDLAWYEGMTEWLPIKEVLSLLNPSEPKTSEADLEAMISLKTMVRAVLVSLAQLHLVVGRISLNQMTAYCDGDDKKLINDKPLIFDQFALLYSKHVEEGLVTIAGMTAQYIRDKTQRPDVKSTTINELVKKLKADSFDYHLTAATMIRTQVATLSTTNIQTTGLDSAVKGGLLASMVTDSKGWRAVAAVGSYAVDRSIAHKQFKNEFFSGMESLGSMIEQSTEKIASTVRSFIDQYCVLVGINPSAHFDLDASVKSLLDEAESIQTAAHTVATQIKGSWYLGYEILTFQQSYSSSLFKPFVLSSFRVDNKKEAKMMSHLYHEGGALRMLESSLYTLSVLDDTKEERPSSEEPSPQTIIPPLEPSKAGGTPQLEVTNTETIPSQPPPALVVQETEAPKTALKRNLSWIGGVLLFLSIVIFPLVIPAIITAHVCRSKGERTILTFIILLIGYAWAGLLLLALVGYLSK